MIYQNKEINVLKIFKWVLYEPSKLIELSFSLTYKESFFLFLKFYFYRFFPIYFITSTIITILTILYYHILNSLNLYYIYDTDIFTNELIDHFSFRIIAFIIFSLQSFIHLIVNYLILFKIKKKTNTSDTFAYAISPLFFTSLYSFLIFIPKEVIFQTIIISVFSGILYPLSKDFKPRISLLLSKNLILIIAFAIFITFSLFYISIANSVYLLLIFNLIEFRMFLFPIQIIKGFFDISFTKNPYNNNELIFLPLYNVDKKLEQLTEQSPNEAKPFITFLLEKRPLQLKLATKLEHIKTFSLWNQINSLQNSEISLPLIPDKMKKYKPSKEWFEYLQLMNQLNNMIFECNTIRERCYHLLEYKKRLEQFKEIHLRESFLYMQEYTKSLNHLLTVVNDDVLDLQAQLQLVEPISPNPYRKGSVLFPVEHRSIFKGRTDEKRELELKIASSDEIPILLIQSQRRVGKTSLLNFLDVLLDKTRFYVIKTDLQEVAIYKSIPIWLDKVQELFKQQFDKSNNETTETTKDWLEAWDKFSSYLITHCQKINQKVIIAIDEYEYFHRLLQQNPEQGDLLLANMRSFCQKQNRVVFLFSGVALMSDLRNPDWAKYFVNTVRIPLDYLSKSDSIELITKPTEKFTLQYENSLPEYIYEQTQGHPHLIHTICSELVDYANKERTAVATRQQYDQIIERLLVKDEQPYSNFWIEFCCTLEMKQTILEILDKQPISHKPSIFRLLDYRYIVKEGDSYRIRIPLYEEWLRRNAYME